MEIRPGLRPFAILLWNQNRRESTGPLAVQAAPVGHAKSRRLSPGSIREKRLVTRGKIAGRYKNSRSRSLDSEAYRAEKLGRWITLRYWVFTAIVGLPDTLIIAKCHYINMFQFCVINHPTITYIRHAPQSRATIVSWRRFLAKTASPSVPRRLPRMRLEDERTLGTDLIVGGWIGTARWRIGRSLGHALEAAVWAGDFSRLHNPILSYQRLLHRVLEIPI